MISWEAWQSQPASATATAAFASFVSDQVAMSLAARFSRGPMDELHLWWGEGTACAFGKGITWTVHQGEGEGEGACTGVETRQGPFVTGAGMGTGSVLANVSSTLVAAVPGNATARDMRETSSWHCCGGGDAADAGAAPGARYRTSHKSYYKHLQKPHPTRAIR